MRIVDFLSIVLAASLTSVNSKPAYDYGTLLLTDDIIRVKKRNEESTRGYLEQCGPVGFPMAERGVVNVLAFLDSSWPYSHRQAIMLKMLNDRLRRSGLPDALFFVVNVDPSFLSAADDAEDEIEKEAWLGVSPDEIESFSDIDTTADSLELSMTPDIRLIQDNENLGIWKNLRGSRDQVLVIDRCGKLTYQVIVPWSILHFPYVKAAILSTYKDEPCGPCDIVRNSTGELYDNKNKTTMPNSTTGDYFQNDRGSMIVSDIPVTTESYLRTKEDMSTVDGAAESFVSSTSEYRFENSQDTNEETSITNFLEFRIATESSTVTNLISKEDNCAMEFESEKFDESTTLPLTMDATTGSTYLHDTDDAMSTSFFTSDTTDSISTVTSGLITEDASSSDAMKVTLLPTEEEISKDEHHLHNVEDEISMSFFTYDTTDSINTVTSGLTTEDASSTDTVKVTLLPAEEEISKNEHHLHDVEDAISTSFFTYDTTDSINTVTSGLRTEDTASSEAVKITRLPAEEEISKNEHHLHDVEDDISTSFFTYDTTDSINTVTSGLMTEDASGLDAVKITRLPAEEEISKNEHYLHGTEDAISTSIFTSDTTDSINTVTSGLTTEDSSSSDAVKITRLPEKEEISTNDHYLDRMKEKFATTTPNPSVTDVTSGSAENYVSTIDTFDGSIETATEETAISTVDKILSSEDQSINETRVEKDDLAISSSGNFRTNLQIEYSAANYDSTKDTIDQKSAETLNSGTTENVRSKENLGKNEDFHLPQDGSKKNEETEETGGLFEIPIRIIMHAPHFHVDGESTRMHEYLVLKTGSSEHHSHLGSHDATRLYSGPQDFHGKSDVIPSEEIEAKPWSMTNVIYNKNESPGLYGEVADFWRDAGSQEIYEDGEDAARPEDQQIAEEAGAEVELWKKPSKANNNNPPETASNDTNKLTVSAVSSDNSSAVLETMGISETDITEKNPTNIEEFNAEEEETRNRLIAHYSKLLPWIYYVLEK